MFVFLLRHEIVQVTSFTGWDCVRCAADCTDCNSTRPNSLMSM